MNARCVGCQLSLGVIVIRATRSANGERFSQSMATTRVFEKTFLAPYTPGLKGYTIFMRYEVQESETRGAFLVTAIEREGQIYSTLFSGPKAKERAEEYADWINSEVDMPKVAPQSR